MKVLWTLVVSAAATLSTQCSTPGSHDSKSNATGDSKNSGSAADQSNKKDDEIEVTGNFRTFTYSLSNNRNTSYVVDKKKAAALAEDIQASVKNPTLKDRRELVALLAVRRLAGGSFEASLKIARSLIDLEMKQSINNDLPEVAKLEMALAAIEERKLSYADYFLEELRKSKSKSVLAAVANADGIIHLLDGKLPEAVASWNDALKVDADYRPALVNIGFTALRFGDYKTAQRALSNMQDDWFALSGLVVAERYSGDAGRASALCDKVLAKKPNYKPVLLSCALNEYQGHNKDEAALAMLNKLVKIKDGSSTVIDEEAYKVISMIKREKAIEQAQQSALKAKRDKEEAEQKAAAEKSKQEAAKPAQGSDTSPAKSASPSSGSGAGAQPPSK